MLSVEETVYPVPLCAGVTVYILSDHCAVSVISDVNVSFSKSHIDTPSDQPVNAVPCFTGANGSVIFSP